MQIDTVVGGRAMGASRLYVRNLSQDSNSQDTISRLRAASSDASPSVQRRYLRSVSSNLATIDSALEKPRTVRVRLSSRFLIPSQPLKIQCGIPQIVDAARARECRRKSPARCCVWVATKGSRRSTYTGPAKQRPQVLTPLASLAKFQRLFLPSPVDTLSPHKPVSVSPELQCNFWHGCEQ